MDALLFKTPRRKLTRTLTNVRWTMSLGRYLVTQCPCHLVVSKSNTVHFKYALNTTHTIRSIKYIKYSPDGLKQQNTN